MVKNPKPELVEKCIEFWQIFMPDCGIKEWNEDNFDVNMHPYTKFMYENKNYAKLSDYARMYTLYTYGGLYLDTDVKLLTNITEIALEPFFCLEKCFNKIGTGLGFSTFPNDKTIKIFLDWFDLINTNDIDYYSMPNDIVDKTFKDNGLNIEFDACNSGYTTYQIYEILGFKIYPSRYFCPIDWWYHNLTLHKDTKAIHYYTKFWEG